MGKEETPGCHQCEDHPEDTVERTVQDCPAWAEHRRVLREAIGGDLSRPALVEAMLRGETEWEAVASFCEAVMLVKEEAGRERERTASSLHPNRSGVRPRRRTSQERDDLRPP